MNSFLIYILIKFIHLIINYNRPKVVFKLINIYGLKLYYSRPIP
ncbi:hypothetical protein rpr22_0883 [Rickettsia prowazekii str. Rp22]|uniref:Uncharacterized protein n=1 Tax=Rickettsia prowazekii (strain Rp22) TaxID=449216 RepID=D5AYA3_RICPP|nr:hypothetical protein rpr22_0883 [Rickettsia prowazekii str. Rp22]